jgi:hypothetical protein
MAMTMVMIMLSGEHYKTSVWGADQDNFKTDYSPRVVLL